MVLLTDRTGLFTVTPIFGHFFSNNSYVSVFLCVCIVLTYLALNGDFNGSYCFAFFIYFNFICVCVFVHMCVCICRECVCVWVVLLRRTLASLDVCLCACLDSLCDAHTKGMGWLRSVGSIKLSVSFAEYHLFYRALLQTSRTFKTHTRVFGCESLCVCVFVRVSSLCVCVCVRTDAHTQRHTRKDAHTQRHTSKEAYVG